MRDALIVNLLSVLPQRRLARLMGWAARLHLPALLHRLLLRWFVRHYRVDMEEAAGRLEDYDSLAALFVRSLREGARPLCEDADAVVSPSDSQVAAFGRVLGDRIPQGGARSAEVRALLGGDHPFEGGSFAVLYLSPPDYHRVHVPISGEVVRWQYLPGRLFPVFRGATERVEGLFARNERLVTWLRTEAGQVAVVMLGAFGVGRMSAVYTHLLSNVGEPAADRRPEPPVPLQKGEELGRFHLGSTVILFFEPGRVAWDLRLGARVKVNARIGAIVTPQGG
ncbi:MAG: archaetidylserine decarboxylase [Pseudomonadota bacterium]